MVPFPSNKYLIIREHISVCLLQVMHSLIQSASNIAHMSADGITLAPDLLTCRRSAWQLLVANLADHNLADDQLQLGNLVCI